MGVKDKLKKTKRVKVLDILSVFPMLVGILVSLFLRLTKKHIWLFCERKNEARDNAYWLFKYVATNHKEISAVYAINKKSPDYKRIANYGIVISFGGIMHWGYYFAAKRNISTHKNGKPNPAICYILEVFLHRRKNRVFLQHGITQNRVEFLFYENSRINLFMCSSRLELKYINDNFGYPEKSIVLTGMCRYDSLINQPLAEKRSVLLMPSMRAWLNVIDKETEEIEGSKSFTDSNYFKTFNSLINNSNLILFLEKNDIYLYFYPHPNMQKYLHLFKTSNKRIVLASQNDFDMQELLKQCDFLITDYSSIHFDFAYMKKPLLYYQFDKDVFFEKEYKSGYFSYDKDGFGPVVETEKDLISVLLNSFDGCFINKDIFIKRSELFFEFSDNSNCQRNYDAIQNMTNEKGNKLPW